MSVDRNLLLFVPGGMRGDALGAAGVWPIATPHLDALANGGMALTAVATSPARRPAYASLFTGLHPRQHGIGARGIGLRPLTGWLQTARDAGYHLAGVGQVGPIDHLLDDARVVAELDETNPQACDYLHYCDRAGLLRTVVRQRRQRARAGLFEPPPPVREPADDIDGFITSAAQSMAERLPTDQRWVMVVAFSGPGNDLPAPPIYLDCVPTLNLDRGFVPPNLADVDPYAQPLYPRTMLQRLDRRAVVKLRRQYLARVCMIDRCVGMVLDAVGRHGHARRTWRALAGDRGHLLGERGLFGGESLMGAGLYTPLWIAPPPGAVDCPHANDEELRSFDGLISTVDLAPTLCELLGIDPPSGAAGVSLMPGLAAERIGRGAVLAEQEDRLMLESLQYRAIFAVDGRVSAVFDLVNDPDEKHNLAGTVTAEDISESLRGRLADLLMPLRATVA